MLYYRRSGNIMPLAFLPEGGSGIVVQIRGGANVLRRISEMGLTEGTLVHVVKSVGPGPLVVEVRGTRIALGRGISMKIFVKVVG